MKMARVILFTGQIDAMSKFYGEGLGLKQFTNEKGWQEFAAGGARSHCIPARHRQVARVRRLYSTPRTSRPCGKRWCARKFRQGPAGGNSLSLRR